MKNSHDKKIKMNQNLRKISVFLQQNELLSAEEKASLTKAIADANKELEIAAFKLDRTEKVKRTTAILLEETIEELEQKRKAVEAQNRELEIESSLERVRTVAMGMRKPDEMLEVCRIISQQSESLGIKEIRNVQTAIIYEDKGTYLNYEYYAKHDKLLVTEVDYKNHDLQSLFANQMLRGAEELFSSALTGKEVQDWYDYQKTTNQFADNYLENAQSLNYYFYSLGPVALGISTYAPLSDQEINLFKRFRNVFDLAYRRFLDIEQAEAQAREAKIEASLERVRAQALSMRKPDDLPGICEVLFTELTMLGFSEIRNAMINIHDDEKASFVNYDYSDEIGKSINQLNYNIHPLIAEQVKQVRSSSGFSETSFIGTDLKDWIAFRKKIGEKDDPRIENTDALYYYFYSIGTGSVGISTFSSIADEKLEILKRFRNVFDFAYRRYTDVAQAEAQARESQIELGLERVRARAMAMQKSEELAELVDTVFKELTKLHFLLDRCIIMIYDPTTHGSTWWMANPEPGSVPVGLFIKNHKHKPYQEYIKAWQAQTLKWEYLLEGASKKEWDKYIFSETDLSLLPEFVIAGMKSVDRVFLNASFNNFGSLTVSTIDPLPESQFEIVLRFAKVFDMTYTRFHDLKQAEVQAREAKIESALERVRSKTMAMHNSRDVGNTVAAMFDELVKLGVETIRCGILIIDASKRMEVWTASPDPDGEVSLLIGSIDVMIHPLLEGAYLAWKNKEPVYTYELVGEDLLSYYNAITGSKDYDFKFAIESLPDKQVNTDFFFHEGALFAFTTEPLSADITLVFKRFAGVFGLTYRRFLDLQKAEANARESQIEAGLERVRSRTLAMQKSDELAETAAVVFRQLINLGIAPNRLYIAIIKDKSGNIEFWITDEDGNKVSTQFTGNSHRNGSIQKMYDGWDVQEKSITIDMQGTELEEYIHYLGDELKVPFKKGLSQKRRVQTLAYFSKGFIGLASPDEQPEETTRLLERFAGVFNLTFTRFNDLKLAEAQAQQAHLDLIHLQTEKNRAEEALAELKATQAQLIQSEKMASLGELTAGIAHEIQNPLNFVNNFSEVNAELIAEMKEEIDKGNLEEIKALANDIEVNEQKINHHGKRADAIVKGMLQHSRSSNGLKEPTDINALADEYLRLAYHGLRAKDKSFNATLKTDFDETIGKIDIIPQDIGRVILNLITNAFYVVDEKKKQQPDSYEPTVSVSTKKLFDKVLISVKDNGNGIPQKVLDKIFQPFFTTKPTGEGTGLGLSLAYDIVKAHGGELKIETKEGDGAKFIILIPVINPNAI